MPENDFYRNVRHIPDLPKKYFRYILDICIQASLINPLKYLTLLYLKQKCFRHKLHGLEEEIMV